MRNQSAIKPLVDWVSAVTHFILMRNQSAIKPLVDWVSAVTHFILLCVTDMAENRL